MAENESPTKVESEQNPPHGDAPAQTEESAEDLLSLDDLDAAIAQEDPTFAETLVGIGPDDPNSTIYLEGVESEYKLEDEVKHWQTAHPRLHKFFPFLAKTSYKLKMKRAALRLSFTKWKEETIHGLKNLGPTILKKIKGLGASAKEGIASFKSWSLKQKLAFVGLVIATGVGGFVIIKAVRHQIVPKNGDLFMGSFQEWAESSVTYDPKSQVEAFYDSTRVAQNIMQLKKMVTNIKRSENSGVNPMGAFEFYLEGTVAEVLVEIKDREPEITDLFLGTLTEMTYDQLASAEGKQLLGERLRKNINGVLTTGKVRRVFIKSAIIKP